MKFCADPTRRRSAEQFLHRSRDGKNSAEALDKLRLVRAIDESSATPSYPFTMARPTPNGLTQAFQALRLHSSTSCRPVTRCLSRQTRPYATEAEGQPSVIPTQEQAAAAPEIDFSNFARRPARIVPASPSYFSGSPRFIDHVLKLESLQAKYASLPTVAAGDAPRMAWFKLAQFRDYVGEPVPMKKYKSLVKILQRLNRIQPEMVPREVKRTLESFLRPGNPYAVQHVPRAVDENGRARAKGKRKESTAVVQLVEGEGEVLVNGKTLVEAFQRVHDRESALWALRSTQRLDKYNVWITVRGGGVTGQAEAITLAIGRALLMHEPALKPVLRKGMFILLAYMMFRGHILTICVSPSRCDYCRCPSCGEKEAWSRQGPQDAYLGQALKREKIIVERCFSTISFYSCIILPAWLLDASPVLYPVQCIWGFSFNQCYQWRPHLTEVLKAGFGLHCRCTWQRLCRSSLEV